MNKRLEDIVGLDWSDGRIVAARVDASPLGAVRLLNVGWADVPADAADDVVAAAIKKVWHSAGMPSRTVAVALRGRSVVVRPFDYSSLHPEEFHAALRLEAEEALQLPQDKIALDWHINKEGASETPSGPRSFSGLLVAAPLQEVRQVQNILQMAGLFPVVMEPGATAMANLYRATHREPGACEDVCVLYLTRQSADISILFNERGLYARSLFARGGSWGDGMHNLHVGLQDALKYYVFKLRGLPVRRIVVTGQMSDTPGLVEGLQSQTGLPVSVWNLLGDLKDTSSRVHKKLLEDRRPAFAVSMGLSLRGYSSD
ncbi:MAG: pilus assembly protein PilM [Kiritimatiellae bacterium]|nr:pilus assembly protein PilM [Kiritimatiellia bacterium]